MLNGQQDQPAYGLLDVDAGEVTFDEMLLIATRAFHDLGTRTVRLWAQYNRAYFGGALKPIPVLYVPVSPYGHWVGQTRGLRLIYLMFEHPRKRPWPLVRDVLLHEMVHQALLEQGRDPHHKRQPWCNEIMRISRDYFGKTFWAGREAVGKVRTGKRRKSFKFNVPGPNGEESLKQAVISSWPHSVGIVPPDLSGAE